MREVLGDTMVTTPAWEVWERVAPPGLEHQTGLRESLSVNLAEGPMDEQAVCEAMLTTGATQEQIAQQLGTTRKTVERRLSRGSGAVSRSSPRPAPSWSPRSARR
ncbi:hypothetical protein [Streptomyces europaeiscabiei]|uniref:hypothetical protein n=1 Tax=Streptomyces europaeiscabiei TaxID=146819 RepID=UPI002E0F142D|nr:hypothetical protein OHB30_48980 [Streptomyces europaeiscabiei]